MASMHCWLFRSFITVCILWTYTHMTLICGKQSRRKSINRHSSLEDSHGHVPPAMYLSELSVLNELSGLPR